MHFSDYMLEDIIHLRKVQLMILKDFINICENNEIEFFSYGGTTLGAVRHNGYIPWDDDIDVIMFREEYEKFVEVFDKLNCKKYSLLSLEDTEDYFYFHSKLSLNGSEFKQSWARETKFNLGINIDIFILEYLPDTKIKRIIYSQKANLIKYILATYIVTLNKNYPSFFKKIIAIIGIIFLNIFKITPDKIKEYYLNMVRANDCENNTLVFENGALCYNKPFNKTIFRPPKKIKFEDIEISVPNDYDTYLKNIYGNYMELPPEEDRIIHEHEYIDFGEY